MDIKVLTVKAFSDGSHINLYFQSEVLEKFFKESHEQAYGSSQPDTLKITRSWGQNNLGYSVPRNLAYSQFIYWGGRLYEKGKPNLAFLTAKGLKDGVTFKIKNLILNEKILDKFVEDLKKELSLMYQQYFQPFEVEDTFFELDF